MSLLLAGVLACALNASQIKESAEHEVMNISAYTSSYEDTGKTPEDPEYNNTSSGKKASRGITIAASKDIPFGTEIYIPYFDGLDGWSNGGIFTVQDRGGAITKNHIDVYMTSAQEMKRFGRRNLDVYILGRCNEMSEEKSKKDEQKKTFKKKQDENKLQQVKKAEDTQQAPVNKASVSKNKDNSLLIVLCTVCNTPLGFPRDVENDLLKAQTFTCPNCRQKSHVTKELKQYILYC
jgi:3D (Asp-Asp-Asp) domain-containing protein